MIKFAYRGPRIPSQSLVQGYKKDDNSIIRNQKKLSRVLLGRYIVALLTYYLRSLIPYIPGLKVDPVPGPGKITV